jgi:hypothetical protein
LMDFRLRLDKQKYRDFQLISRAKVASLREYVQ